MLNQGYAYRTIVDRRDQGRTLLGHLASAYPHTAAAGWQQRLDDGEVTLDGAAADGDELLRAGQTLVWRRPPWLEPEVPQGFEVLLEDEWLLAVNKPSGLPTLPGGGYLENTLLRLVQRRFADAHPVHRLGRATSGIVLFARTAQVAARLSEQWNTVKVQKTYRALAQGVAEHDAYEIHTRIGLVPHSLIGTVWAASESGKASRSVAKVISRSGGRTTFAVSLFSGRPHQIRIHLASIGHPLVGDPLYGPGGLPMEGAGLPGDGGYLLHAQCLRFEHPVTGEETELEAAVPGGDGVQGVGFCA